MSVQTYPDELGNNNFAILDGSKEFSIGWVRQAGTNFTFEQGIPYKGFAGLGITGIGFYSYIYVIEIDKELEKTAPITARRLLQFVKSVAAVDSIPGSFYSPIYTWENPKLMYIHTSDGSSPNLNPRFRYEVTVRDWGVDSYSQPNNVFENLWVRGFGAGNGMLPGGSNTTYNKIVFGTGAGIHHIGAHSGTINHSLFLPSAKNTSEFAVVFYDTEGLGRHCIIQNSMFLDIPAPMYMHTHGTGTNYSALEIDNIVAFADTSSRQPFSYTSNNDTVLLNNVYADGFSDGYHYGSANYAAFHNCYFKDVGWGISYGDNVINSLINNVFIKTKGTSFPVGIYLSKNTSAVLKNSIVHIINNSSANPGNSGSFVYGTGGVSNKIVATNNIFICDIAPSATLFAAATNTNNGKGTSGDTWDNNVYILLKGNKLGWRVTNPATNKGTTIIDNFDEWKGQSGQDKHSLFFDLRNDPRGLRAIFMDPGNGNYDLANTSEARQVAALGAGMISPLTCFIRKPTYEEAFNMIKNNIVLSVNECRNPCQQNTLRVNNTLTATSISVNQVVVKWNIPEQQNVGHYELQRAVASSSVFKKIAVIPVGSDSVYSFTDKIEPGMPYKYRLLVIAQAGNACYSDPKLATPSQDKSQLFFIYPNPSSGKLRFAMNGYLGKGNFTILNTAGTPVMKREFFSLYAPQQIDLSQQPKGMYFVRMETSEGISTQKFVIE